MSHLPSIASTIAKIVSVSALALSASIALAGESRTCSHDQQISNQIKGWLKSAETLQLEVQKYSSELETTYSEASNRKAEVDAKTEESLRMHWNQMELKQKALYSEADLLAYSARTHLRSNHVEDCEKALAEEADKLHRVQSSLYNDLLQADPLQKAATRVLKAQAPRQPSST